MLLAGACERKTSGTFTFRHGGRIDVLTLRSGKIAVVRTAQPVFYLGAVLSELAPVEQATLSETLLEAEATSQLHGALLVAAGAVSREQVEASLVEQTVRKTRHLFDLPDATAWSFREDVDELSDAPDEDRPLVDTWLAIWRGLRDRFPSGHVRQTLAKIDGGLRLRDAAVLDQFGLDPEDRAVCACLADQPHTLAELLKVTTLSVERTEMLVYLLALARCVVRVEMPPVGPIELGVEGVRERARRIVTEDPRTALGVRPGQSIEATRAIYFRLARLWHPERLPSALAELRAECELVLEKLTESLRLLVEADATERRLSEPPMTEPGALSLRPSPLSVAPSSIDPKRPRMSDVDAALSRGDLESAEAMAHALSTGGADGPGARAVIAWCGAGAGSASTTSQALERALVALDRVVLGDPDCVRALFYRAQLEMRLGLTDAALRDYRKVVRLDPRHVEAARELRLHEAPGRPSLLPGMPGRSMAPPAKVISIHPDRRFGTDTRRE